MAYRSEKLGFVLFALIASLAAPAPSEEGFSHRTPPPESSHPQLVAPASSAQRFSLSVRRQLLGRDHPGDLVFDDAGAAFQPLVPGARQRPLAWAYPDIQQLWISPRRVKILTYEDRVLLLGRDREHTFLLASDTSLDDLLAFLRARLDARLVVAAPTTPAGSLLWETPAKLTGPLRGAHGTLRAAADGLVFETSRPEASRSWRFDDIDAITQSGPFEFTVITFERSLAHYGSRKAFLFQLKRPLPEEDFQLLFRCLLEVRHGPALPALQLP